MLCSSNDLEREGIPFESELEREEFIHEQEEFFAEQRLGDLRVNNNLLILATANEDPTAPLEIQKRVFRKVQIRSGPMDCPFVRAAATDLNFTVAFALYRCLWCNIMASSI